MYFSTRNRKKFEWWPSGIPHLSLDCESARIKRAFYRKETAKRASIHCHYILHRKIFFQKKSKPWPCSFGSWRYLYSKSQSVGFQHVEMTTATLALCGQVCSWNSLKHRRFWTPIFNEIWVKCHLDEGKKEGSETSNKTKIISGRDNIWSTEIACP